MARRSGFPFPKRQRLRVADFLFCLLVEDQEREKWPTANKVDGKICVGYYLRAVMSPEHIVGKQTCENSLNNILRENNGSINQVEGKWSRDIFFNIIEYQTQLVMITISMIAEVSFE